MKNFLKKYSDVPNGFLDDFFNISKESYRDNQFIINFDIVVKWLNVQKQHLKRLLVKHFEEKYDYILNNVKIKNKNRGSNYKHIIYLTPDCFKELCMISQTAKAKEVRKYYLSIEKLMKKYHQHIEDKLYKELGLLKKNQKPKVDKKRGIVYILKALNTTTSVYKIGRTKNLNKRMNNYNADKANDIEPLFILEVDDIDKVESCIKLLVKDFKYRKYKEVYEIDFNILKSAFFRCDELVSGFGEFFEKGSTKDTKRKIKELKLGESKYFAYISKK